MSQAEWDVYVLSLQQKNQVDALISLIQQGHERELLFSVVGGYGLDALYGRLTRDHHDFDIVIKAVDEANYKQLLVELGYRHFQSGANPDVKRFINLSP
ncbi:MAG: hypothetical protein AAF702_46565 [Chloroflexota bacterium]